LTPPPRLAPLISPAHAAPVAQAPRSVAATGPASSPAVHASGERAVAYGLGAVGLAGLMTGSVFALMALHDRDTLREECPNHDCKNPDSLDAATSGARSEKIANVGFIAGAVGVVASGVLFWHSGRATAAVSLSPQSASLAFSAVIQ